MTVAVMGPATPLLGFGPPGWIAYGVLGVAAVGVTGYGVYQAWNAADTSFPDSRTGAQTRTRTATRTCTEDCEIHRGRVQAQGNGLERSIPWGQPTPPTVAQGVGMLNSLYGLLSRSEQGERELALAQAIRWVQGRPPAGVYAVVKMSFPRPALRGGVRMDIEVLVGKAFLT